MAESLQERQDNEFEALQAIFGPALHSTRTEGGPWQPLDCWLTLGPQRGSSFGPHQIHAQIDLHVVCSPNYPNDVPELHLEKSKGLSSQQLKVLKQELGTLGNNLRGEVMIFELAQHIEKFLHQYNKPGHQSFYEEMVTRQKLEKEREIQKIMQVEAKKRQLIRDEIQTKQCAVREEIRRRRISLQNMEDDDDDEFNITTVNNKSPELKTSFSEEELPSAAREGTLECNAVITEDKNKNFKECDGTTNSEEFTSPWSISKGNSRITSEFEVLKWLGRGAFGDVLKVRNKLDDCLYAIKRIELNPLNRQLNKKITREVKLLSRLNHENVVRYFNSWLETEAVEELQSAQQSETDKETIDFYAGNKSNVDWSLSRKNVTDDSSDDSSESDCWIAFLSGSDGSESTETISSKAEDKTESSCGMSSQSALPLQFMYIQMEFCEKNTLRSAMDEGLYLDVPRVWRLLREIAEGLSHIHQQGIIHRDLKPVNIFIDCDDHVKIGDFGLATTNIFIKPSLMPPKELGVIWGGGDQSDLTSMSHNIGDTVHTGRVGTALYVAPELNSGLQKASYNQKVDIFSLGIIFFEMCFHPLPTNMERIKVLSDLRLPHSVLPHDFQDVEMPQQAFIIRWLLSHDPALRPTAQELLLSQQLPPPQLEEAALHEMVRHTLSNPQSKAYKHLVEACFKQRVSTGQDATYDMSQGRGGRYLSLVESVGEKVRAVFRLHGGVCLVTPLLTPLGRGCPAQLDSGVCLMTRWGGIVTAPHNLRVPFARYLAQNPSITHLKRYAIDRVYRERRVFGLHPKELYECAFDIVTPTPGNFMAESELLSIVWEIFIKFPILLQKNCLIRLNHTSLVKAILLHCCIEEEKHAIVCDLLTNTKMQNEAYSKSWVEKHLTSIGLSEHTISALLSFMDIENTYSKVFSFLRSVMRKDGEVAVLAKQGFRQLEVIINNAETLGVKCPMVIAPGLVDSVHQYSGMMCQFVWDQKGKQKQVSRNVLAAGGRYDDMIVRFRQMVDAGKEVSQSAAGISLSLDKMAIPLAEQEETNMAATTDVVICSVGRHPMCREKLAIARDLWASGISSTVLDSVENLEEVQDYCTDLSKTNMVILKDTEPGSVRVRSFIKDRFQEKKISQGELLELFQRLVRCPMNDTSVVIKSESKYTNQLDAAMVNTTFLTIEKISTATKRRFENQIINSLTSTLQRLSPKVKVEVFALNLEVEALKMLAFYMELEGEDQDLSPVIKRFPRHKKYLIYVCDQIREKKSETANSVIILYSLIENSFKIIL